MGNSKIVYYGETLIDLTGDTVEPAKLLKGITAHDKKGEKITGTFEAAAPYAIISVTYPSALWPCLLPLYCCVFSSQRSASA